MERRHFLRSLAALMSAGAMGGCLAERQVMPSSPELPNYTAAMGNTQALAYDAPPALSRPGENATGHVPLPSKPITAISRTAWHAGNPIRTRIQAMGAVNRLTIHHEGSPHANWDTAADAVATRLKRIQAEHRQRMQAADIGYHFIVDRKGRVWQGRDVRFQGAHVSRYNPHNIGVMLLGNFDLQRPSRAQLDTFTNLAATLMRGYRISTQHLYRHCDLGNTRCPGNTLKPYLANLKTQWA